MSLVAILDADKEGFLVPSALIQTIVRAARYVEGVALLYADNMTDSMAKAISKQIDGERFSRLTMKNVVPTAASKKATNSILNVLELSGSLKRMGQIMI